MKNKHCYLFIIKNLLDKRDTAKIERFFQNLLEPHLANITIDDTEAAQRPVDVEHAHIALQGVSYAVRSAFFEKNVTAFERKGKK